MGTKTATDWIPLARAMEGNEAEMARGFLESQGISVQLRPAQRGTFNFQNSSIGGALLHQADLFVPRDTAAMASEILGAIRPTTPEMDYVEPDENLVRVYDETGKLQQYRLSPGRACPTCGEEGLQHTPKKEAGWVVFSILCVSCGVIILNVFGMFHRYSNFVSTTTLLIGSVGVLYELRLGRKYPETWHCPHCNKNWRRKTFLP